MATIIKSIALKNFYNYYGDFEQNCYEFTEGLNIINADNNLGKSKFYNGVLWILKDEVYDSDSNLSLSVVESLLKMASDKARAEKDIFETAVRMVVQHDSKEYTIIKSVIYRKSEDVWEPGKVEVSVTEMEEGRTKPIYDFSRQKDIIQKIIPTELLNYVLLQGESLERLVDSSSPGGLSKTIETLAEMSELLNTCQISKYLAGKARSLLNSKERELANNLNNIDKKIREKEQIEKYIEETQNKVVVYQNEKYAFENIKERMEALQVNATKREKFRGKKERLDFELKELMRLKNEGEKQITSRLFAETSPWLLMGLKSEIDRFSALRDKWVEDKTTLRIAKEKTMILLPNDSPDVLSLKRMLDREWCEVCNREATRNTPPWNHIKTVMERPKKEDTSTRNDFSQFYSSLQNSVGTLYNSIDDIGCRIEKYQDYLKDLNVQIEDKKEEWEQVKIEFINAGGDEERSDKDVISEYSLAERNVAKYEKLIGDAEEKVEHWKQRLKQIDQELADNNSNKRINDYRMFRDLMADIERIFKGTKDQVYDNIIKDLFKHANEKYQELTEGNFTSGGFLTFSRQETNRVQVSIKNRADGEITGLGKGFQRMKQLAIVMAVISSKIGSNHLQYPFIADAPFSEFGNNFINNFFKVAPKVFTQSIILIKELYDPTNYPYINLLGQEILNKMREGNIKGTFYTNIMEGKPDTIDMVTKHERNY